MRFSLRWLALAALAPVLLSCANEPRPTPAPPVAQQEPEVLSNHVPTPVPDPAIAEPRRPISEVIRGTGTFVGKPTRRSSSATIGAGGEVSLDFAGADIRDVVKAVLGDLLKVNYTVDAKAQGTLTIQTNHPVAHDAVLAVFEQALRLNGLSVVKSGDLYQVVPSGDAVRQSGLGLSAPHHGNAQSGFGVEIVPLQFMAATEIKQLLEPMMPAGALVQTDPTRNLLLIGGTEQERASIIEDIGLFDADWLAGMSFAMYFPQAVEAKVLAKDLGQLIGGKDSPVNGMIRLVPIERLNMVLAISPQPRYLDELQGWVERLDKPGETVDQRLYVYRVENGRAADLAGVLTKVLSTNGSSASTRSESTEDIAPNARSNPLGGEKARPMPLPLPISAATATDASDHGIRLSGIGNPTITADEVNNALVILASPREYAIIEAALKQLDAIPLQVFLEAAVAEVTLTNDLKYGVQYYFNSRGIHQGVLSSSASTTISPTLPGFAYSFTSGKDINIILSALEGLTKVDVVSAPQLLVLNNQTATLQVGDQVPIATQQAVSVATAGAPIVNSIQFRDTGVILKVTPRVNQGGMVTMDISQEVSDVSTTTTSSLDSPTIEQRKISSTVAVQDGETIALGGLIKDSKTDTKSGIPLLQDVPYLGALFGTTENQGGRTELLILLTPHVVEGTQKARAVTQELRQKLQATQSTFQRVH